MIYMIYDFYCNEDMMYKNKDDSIRKNEAMEWQDKWTSTLV